MGLKEFTGFLTWGKARFEESNFDDIKEKQYGVEASEHLCIIDYTKHFVDCVVHGKEPLVSGEDGRRSLELSLAAKRSAKEGRIISL